MTSTPEQIEAECIALAASPPRYNWERGYSEGAYTWGEWYDAAVTALDTGDFSEYTWMLEKDAKPEAPDTFVDDLCDFALAAVRSTTGMVSA